GRMRGALGARYVARVVPNRSPSQHIADVPPQIRNNPQFGDLLNQGPQAVLAALDQVRQTLQAQGVPVTTVQQVVSALQQPIPGALASAITTAFLIGAIVVAFGILATALIPEIALRKGSVRPSVVAEGAADALGGELAADVASAVATDAATEEEPASEPAGSS